jgi:hypothetical protein
VECDVTPGLINANARVNFFLYAGVEGARSAFEQNVPDSVIASDVVCPDGPYRGDYHTPQKNPAGLLACWIATDDGSPYLVWTTDEPSVMATVRGVAGATIADLWPFWNSAVIGPREPAG